MFLLSASGPAASVTPSASSPSARRRESSTSCPQRRSRVRETRFPTHKKVLFKKTTFLFPPQDFVARLADRFNRTMENVCGGGLGRTRWMRELVFLKFQYFFKRKLAQHTVLWRNKFDFLKSNTVFFSRVRYYEDFHS